MCHLLGLRKAREMSVLQAPQQSYKMNFYAVITTSTFKKPSPIIFFEFALTIKVKLMERLDKYRDIFLSHMQNIPLVTITPSILNY